MRFYYLGWQDQRAIQVGSTITTGNVTLFKAAVARPELRLWIVDSDNAPDFYSHVVGDANECYRIVKPIALRFFVSETDTGERERLLENEEHWQRTIDEVRQVANQREQERQIEQDKHNQLRLDYLRQFSTDEDVQFLIKLLDEKVSQ